MSDRSEGVGAVLWVAGMLVAGYLDWHSKHAPKRAADRADERLARQGEETLAAIQDEQQRRGRTLGQVVGRRVRARRHVPDRADDGDEENLHARSPDVG